MAVKRIAVAAGILLALGALGAGVAGAVGTLDKKSVPANTDVDLVLNAPMEQLVGYTEKIVIAVPDGFRALSCGAPAGYTCKQSAATNPTRTLITWENPQPTGAELITPTANFPFRIRTIATPGKYKFDVEQSYSNGQVARYNGGEGQPNAAPILEVTGAGTAPVTNTTAAPSSDPTSDTTTPSPSFDFSTPNTVVFNDFTTSTTTPDTTPTTTSEDTTDTSFPGLTASSSDGGEGDGIRGVERVVLIALALLAVGAASFSTLRHRSA